ncbi:MAG TPA: phosphatase PAP2 family protein [Phaeodactylibacter sp.]|nr:phosphatase PAP2 family protein [Phaeodactylibacter sp.]
MKNLINKRDKHIDTPTLWSMYLSSTRFQMMVAICFISLAFSIRYITHVLAIIDMQTGTLLFDPVHQMMPTPIDLSSIIFFLTYSSVFIVIIDVIVRSPIQVLRLGFAIALMKLLRSFSMVLVPLEPPSGIIPLQDPLVSFMTPNNVVALRDLFFSGHCATMMILLLVAVSPLVKKWMKMIIFVVPFLILWQRVHYTIDVVAGLAVGAAVYWLVMKVVKVDLSE